MFAISDALNREKLKEDVGVLKIPELKTEFKDLYSIDQ